MIDLRSVASFLICGALLVASPCVYADPVSPEADYPATAERAASNSKVAQAASPRPSSPPAPVQPIAPAQSAAPAQTAAPASADAQPADEEPIGNVVKLTGTASVTRNNESGPLKLKDDIFKNDVLKTSANSTLGITFNDATTFNLTANAQITVDNFIYEDGGKSNAALFNVGKGTVAFVASAVAKTGDMKIATPTATLGIRGTSGLVEVPEGAAAAGTNNVNIKLYPDPDGRVGRIEVNDRGGARLGFLTQAASGFAIRPGAGGRFSAAPLLISPQQAVRDQGFVRQVHAAQNFGRRIVTEQRAFRRANPGRTRPGLNTPARPGAPRQGGPQNQNNNVPGRPGPANTPQQRQQQGSPTQRVAPAQQGQQPGTPAQNGNANRPTQTQGTGPQRLQGQRQPNPPGLQRPAKRGPAPGGRPAGAQKRKPPPPR